MSSRGPWRIALLHRNLPPDTHTGVAIQVHRLANALHARGHVVTVITDTCSPAPDALYQRTAWPGNPLADPWIPKRLAYPWACRKLDPRDYDVIHIHGDGAFLPRSATGKVLRTFYGTAAMEARYATTWKGRVAQSFSYVQEIVEALRYGPSAAIGAHVKNWLPGVRHIVPCAVDSVEEPDWGHKSHHPSLLFMGSRGSRKRGEWALRLLKIVRRHHPTLVMHYVCPSKEKQSLEAEVSCRDLAGLHLHSALSEETLAALYRSSWAYLSLSSYEGFGVSLVEAMALGCPVISVPHIGAKEWLRHGESGLLVAPSQLAATVHGLLANPGQASALARSASRQAKNFTRAEVANRYEELYANIAA